MICRDCIHHNVCYYAGRLKTKDSDGEKRIIAETNNVEDTCEDFSDRSAWVKLPCKVGTTVFFVREQTDGKELDIGKISSFGIDGDNVTWIFVRYESDLFYWWHPITDLNNTVFLSREEAERALVERRD